MEVSTIILTVIRPGGAALMSEDRRTDG